MISNTILLVRIFLLTALFLPILSRCHQAIKAMDKGEWGLVQAQGGWGFSRV